MKITITEAQAKRLNLIKEDTSPIDLFEQLCKNKVQEVNNLYSKISVI